MNDLPLAGNDTIGQAQGMFEDRTIVLPGSFFTTNDLAHLDIGFHRVNASNESGQVLTLVDGGATIVSETSTTFGGIPPASICESLRSLVKAPTVSDSTVSRSDLGASSPRPTVSVVQSTIFATLNSNALATTTVNDLIAEINATPAAAALVNLTLTGPGTTAIGNLPTTYAPVVVPPSGGTVSVSGNVFTYTPPLHYNDNIGGPAIVRLTIQDDATAGPVANLTSTATVTINIARSTTAQNTMHGLQTNRSSLSRILVPSQSQNSLRGYGLAQRKPWIEAGGPALGAAIPPAPSAPENQTLTFDNILPSQILVEALKPELFAALPRLTVVGTDATLDFELKADVNREAPFGPILVRVTAQDSGLVGGPNNNLNRSITRTFYDSASTEERRASL